MQTLKTKPHPLIRPVLLKVGGIVPLGGILMDKGAKMLNH